MFRPQTGQQFAGFAEYKRMSVGGLIDPSLLDHIRSWQQQGERIKATKRESQQENH